MADVPGYTLFLLLVVIGVVQAAPSPQEGMMELPVTYDQRQNGSSGNLHLHMDGVAIVEAPADFLMTLGLGNDEETPGAEGGAGGGGFASWQQQLMALMQKNRKSSTEAPMPPPPSPPTPTKPKPVRGSGTKPKLRSGFDLGLIKTFISERLELLHGSR